MGSSLVYAFGALFKLFLIHKPYFLRYKLLAANRGIFCRIFNVENAASSNNYIGKISILFRSGEHRYSTFHNLLLER